MSEGLKIRKESIGGWPAVQLSNSLISLAIVPSIGGRVMDFRLGENNVFYGNPRHYGQKAPSNAEGSDIGMWRNYGGSKVWPAPQGWSSDEEWPGPPDPVFDSGPYESKTSLNSDVAAVHLESQHDEYSGLTLARDIAIRPATSIVHLHHRMRNTSRRPVRWAIWQVTQVDAPKGLDIFIPANGFRQTLGDLPYRKVDFDVSGKRVHLSYDDQVAKFAVQANSGWFASLDRARELVLVETFPFSPGAPYPDGAATAFWVSGAGTFTIHGDCIDMTGGANGCDPHVETEVMGPLTDLEAGKSCELRTAWRLAAIRAEEIISVNHCGVVGQRLAVEAGRVTGSFGVFHEANLELVAFDRISQVAGRFALGKVSPLRPAVLDERISLPSSAVRCSLMLFDVHEDVHDDVHEKGEYNNDGNKNGQQKNLLGTLDHVQVR
jgi:hypothetical protein